jgi:hypothetical protein
MPKKNFRFAGVAALTLLMLVRAQVASGAESPSTAPPSIEPRAIEILNSALKHLAGAASMTLRAEVINETTLPSGEKLQYPGTLEIFLRRPDRLSYRLDSERRRVAAWYDGKQFTLLDSEKNVCASTPAPNGLNQLFDDMATRLGFRPPLSVLLRDDSARAVAEHMESGFYVGRGVVGGTDCHHLAFRQQNVDLQLWVAVDGPPMIRRIVVTSKTLPAAPQQIYTIAAWDFNAVLGDAVFVFEPPPGVVRCEFQSLVK